MEVIAKSRSETMILCLRGPSVAGLLLSCTLLSGCMGSGLDFASGIKVDRSVKTSTIPGQIEERTDEATVRNAVSSADLALNAGKPIPWANTASGSAGVINRIVENRDEAGRTCRDFATTLHSYKGIANFTGKACMTRDGDWLTTTFDRQG
ncbi:hypothetical protein LXM94_09310 [Rhizobium sp. TRM95111]|uniref:RT0821/Lpp0805 family surface protein n=1 Tax=Rhizobium alarense TaxID=2846851 RepID=UPI001EFF1D7A|nr:RT0821/Lpp0805 family surface protein [Rhizobium alarense]MCF3640166.1 hypothetical protein [Rhizobium alarense]